MGLEVNREVMRKHFEEHFAVQWIAVGAVWMQARPWEDTHKGKALESNILFQ